jgi:hypothetical protein
LILDLQVASFSILLLQLYYSLLKLLNLILELLLLAHHDVIELNIEFPQMLNLFATHLQLLH